MLSQRIIGAFTFRRQVYVDVAKDKSFTNTAWVIVVVTNLISALSTFGQELTEPIWVLILLLTVGIGTASFALGAQVVTTTSKSLFKAKTSFAQMVRVSSLARIWGVFALIMLVVWFLPDLFCLVYLSWLIIGLLSLISWFIGVKETLKLSSNQTFVIVLAGVIMSGVINFFGSSLLLLLGAIAVSPG